MAQSSPFQSYSEKKERRTSMTETIHEVDEEDDSPIRSDDASNWHGEEEFIATNRTTADDSSQSVNSSPMNSTISTSSAIMSPASISTASPLSVKHFESPEPPSNPTVNSTASVNKYDNTKHQSSYQSAVTEKKKEEIIEKKEEMVEKIVTIKKAEVDIPAHSDLKEVSSPSPQDSNEVKETIKMSPDRNTQINIMEKNKNNKVDISNENNPSVESKEYSRTTSLPELNIAAANAPPLVPARNNFSPYLTPPLGSEEEETLEVRELHLHRYQL